MEKTGNLNNKGFSLIEMLISLAIAGVIGVSAYSIVIYGMNRYAISSKETKLQTEIQFTSNIISDAIKTGEASTSRIEVRKSGGEIKEVIVYTGINTDSNGEPELVDGNIMIKKQAIYYNAEKKSVYIYDASETIGSGDELHLVSNAVCGFEAKYEQTTADEIVDTDIYPEDDELDVYYHESDLISVDIDYELSDLKRNTLTTYKIRNR